MFTPNKTLALGLLAACAIGCGGDDGKSQVAGPDGATNGSTNAGSNNGSTTGANNGATTGANNGSTTGANNGSTTGSNNGTPIDPPPMGTVVFAGSADLAWYTNGPLTVQIAVGEGAEDVALVLGDDEVLVEFGNQTEYTWDTSTLSEGAYTLKLRYSVGGDERWSDDARTVIVDRNSPKLAGSTPEANSDAASDAALTLTFDEMIDPATVSPATVTLELTNGQTPSYTTSLSADGLTIGVEFDRSTVAPPYSALVSVNGVTDLAGNAANDGFSYAVPAWFDNSISASLSDPHYFVVGTSQFVLGVSAGTPNDMVQVYEKTNRLGASFQQVAALAAGQIYDLAADVADGKIHIAVLRNQNAGGLMVKSAQLLEFNPSDDSIVESGRKGIGVDSNNGAIALDMRELSNETRGGLAVVSDSSLSVYTFVAGGLVDSTQNSFPSGTYDYVRDEDLSVHIRQDSLPDVVFARCTSGAATCYRTQYKHMGFNGGSGWTEHAFDVITPLNGANASCDEYTNFDTTFANDVLTMFAAFVPCNASQTGLFAVDSLSRGAVDVTTADLMSTMSGPDDRYTTHVATGPQGLHTLLASRTQMLVGEVGATAATWHAEVASDLDTDDTLLLKRIREPRLYVDDSGKPVVVFRHGGNIHIRRAN